MTIPSIKPRTVILFGNGMVMAFDESGKQMEAYQGRYELVAAALIHADLEECDFQMGAWGRSLQNITQEQFFAAEVYWH